jgi:hypothetical protein
MIARFGDDDGCAARHRAPTHLWRNQNDGTFVTAFLAKYVSPD